MAVSPRVTTQSTALTASAATYIAGSLARRKIDKCTIYNSDTVARTVTIHLIPSGGSAVTANIVMVKTVQAGETYTCPEVAGHNLDPSDFLQALASTASVVNLRTSSYEVS